MKERTTHENEDAPDNGAKGAQGKGQLLGLSYPGEECTKEGLRLPDDLPFEE